MTTTNVNDFLLAGGIAAAKFPTIGTTVKGTVVASEVTQQTDFATGELKFWDKDKQQPKMQAVITLQTDERDPAIEDDDGQRKLYVKGQMTAALRDALKAVGAKLDIGGTLAVKYVEDKPVDKGNPQKIYRAQYKPGTASVDATNDLLDGGSAEAPASSGAGVPADDLI